MLLQSPTNTSNSKVRVQILCLLFLVSTLTLFILILSTQLGFYFKVRRRDDIDEDDSDPVLGSVTVPRDHPNYMAFLVSSYSIGDLACRGTVISDRYVLTAAHCVYSDTKSPYEIASRVSVYLKVHTEVNPMENNRQPIVVTGSNIKPHPNYLETASANFMYDIALLKLNQDLPSHYERIKLFKPVYQGSVPAARWGRKNSRRGSAMMQQVDVKVGTKEECEASWGSFYNHEFQMCVASPGKSVCKGDSGGPVIHFNSMSSLSSQIGIISFGHADSNNNPLCEKSFAVFTRMSAHYEWIHQTSCYQDDWGLCSNWAYA